MKPILVEIYKTSDGKLFECEDKAEDHQENIVGELLDGFLPNDDRGNVTQADRYNILMKQLKDPKLVDKLTALYNAVTFGKGD